MGIAVQPEEVVASSYAAAAYLKEQRPEAKVLVLGNPGMCAELEQAGLNFVRAEDVPYCASSEPWTLDDFTACTVDPEFTAVLVGFMPHFNFRHMCYASMVVRENRDCLYVATNVDAGDRVAPGRVMPGTGCFISGISMAVGRQPVVAGKGGDWLLPHLLHKYGLQPQDACMVGDRLDTDIAMGKEGGLRTVLPLTGVTTLEDVKSAPAAERPDFVVPSLVEMVQA